MRSCSIRDPDNRKRREDETAPVIEQKLVSRKPENEDRYIVAEAVLPGKQIEKLSLEERAAAPALAHAILPRFTKDLFVSHCPAMHATGMARMNAIPSRTA